MRIKKNVRVWLFTVKKHYCNGTDPVSSLQHLMSMQCWRKLSFKGNLCSNLFVCLVMAIIGIFVGEADCRSVYAGYSEPSAGAPLLLRNINEAPSKATIKRRIDNLWEQRRFKKEVLEIWKTRLGLSCLSFCSLFLR